MKGAFHDLTDQDLEALGRRYSARAETARLLGPGWGGDAERADSAARHCRDLVDIRARARQYSRKASFQPAQGLTR